MRIGTWNMEGKWSSQHCAFLQREECDVWLLTEVRDEAALPGMEAYRTAAATGPHKRWAAIMSHVKPEDGTDPHLATACAVVGGIRFVSSVLPWRSCGASWPGVTLAEKQALTLDALRRVVDDKTVWGGDWNQAFEGRDHVGTLAGRATINDMLQDADLSLPTRSLGSDTVGHRSIDHIAVPVTWDVQAASQISAQVGGRRLSDHDAYVVTIKD